MNNKEIFENRAYENKDEYDRMIVDDRKKPEDDEGEILVFSLKDSTHEFSMGLSTVLKLLKFAEENGFVPKIPEWWWNEVLRF